MCFLSGIAAQGRSFKLRNVTDNGVGSFAGGHGEPGSLVGEKGTLSYFEVCTRIFSVPVLNVMTPFFAI